MGGAMSILTENIPTDYKPGYEKARAVAPEIASNYVAHTHWRPTGRSDDGRPRTP